MKLWNYIFIAITLMIVMQFIGIPTGIDELLGFMDIVFNTETNALEKFSLTTSGFLEYLVSQWLVGLVVVGAISVGLWWSGESAIALRAGIASAIFIKLTAPMYVVLSQGLETNISPWAIGILAVIFVPFSVGFLIALIEYIIGGND